MGSIVRLEDCFDYGFYTGGLDDNGSDGEYGLLWKDSLSQVMFHVATLMPNLPTDKNFTNKKRHM